MAAERRGQTALNIDLSSTSPNAAPPISALFLIHFDIKAGYTIKWKQSLPGIELEGVVEYKSLPSGLHTVEEDLIYFVHEDHAGLSAFVNAPASEESRNARMIAVGVLVPLSFGRLGRAWKHAEALKDMASELITDIADTKLLEGFWEENKAKGSALAQDSESVLESPSSMVFKPARLQANKPKHGRNRSASDGTALIPPGHRLSTYHPAWSLPALLDTFGPLIFPLQRAALLRKRILITTHAPVEQACNFVYDLSILSNVPLAVLDLLSPDAPPQRLRPLFQIGIHDIPLLEADLQAMRNSPSVSAATSPGLDISREELGTGWIACTTDSILAMKTQLYDILITLPEPHTKNATEKQWPKIETSEKIALKATQRDARRYKALLWGLSRHDLPLPSRGTPTGNDILPRTKSTTSFLNFEEDSSLNVPDTDSIIEPLSWSAFAYTGYMWWASAGSSQTLSSSEQEEADSDSNLLSGLNLVPSTSSPSLTSSSPQIISSTGKLRQAKREGEAQQEMAIIAYFHRLTSQIFTTLSDIIDSVDSDDEREAEQSQLLSSSQIGVSRNGQEAETEEDVGPRVYVNSNDVARMGLDVWSQSNVEYVEAVARLWFGRRAEVEGQNLDVCGVRIC